MKPRKGLFYIIVLEISGYVSIFDSSNKGLIMESIENVPNNQLSEILLKLSENGELHDLKFFATLYPSVSFIFNDTLFSLTLTDRLGTTGEYRTIATVVEVNAITDSLGCYDVKCIDEVVKTISNYIAEP